MDGALGFITIMIEPVLHLRLGELFHLRLIFISLTLRTCITFNYGEKLLHLAIVNTGPNKRQLENGTARSGVFHTRVQSGVSKPRKKVSCCVLTFKQDK